MIDLSLELALSAGMFVLTIILHLFGLMALVQLGRLHIERWRTPWLHIDRILVPTFLATGLAAIHVVEVMAYAALFQTVGATTTWEQSIYYSAASYSTAGVPGLSFSPGWRVLASLEALNGILLIGWSTAFLFQTLHRILNAEGDHPFPAGAIAPEPDEDSEQAAAEQEAQG